MKFENVKRPGSTLFWVIAVAAALFVTTGFAIAPAPPHDPTSDTTLVSALPAEPTSALPRSASSAQTSDDLPESDPSAHAIGLPLP